jgi:biotin operon repressor
MSVAAETFVEQFAVILEAEGTPRVAGRLFALLIVSAEPQSLDDLAEQLGVSKASVSVNARYLEDRGKIERVSRTGDRRDYYQIGDDILERAMEDRMARVRRIQQVIAGARAGHVFKNDVVSRRLEMVDAAHQHILEANQRALNEWRAKRHKTPSSNKSR